MLQHYRRRLLPPHQKDNTLRERGAACGLDTTVDHAAFRLPSVRSAGAVWMALALAVAAYSSADFQRYEMPKVGPAAVHRHARHTVAMHNDDDDAH